jgi:hypothetical protein
MRIYESATIKEELLTGFQSPCSEFADKPVSFDERYGIGNPGIKLLKVENDFPHLGVFKNDLLLVDLAKKPGPVSLVITILDDEIKLFQGNKLTNLDDVVCGVVKVIIRNAYENGVAHEYESQNHPPLKR